MAKAMLVLSLSPAYCSRGSFGPAVSFKDLHEDGACTCGICWQGDFYQSHRIVVVVFSQGCEQAETDLKPGPPNDNKLVTIMIKI